MQTTQINVSGGFHNSPSINLQIKGEKLSQGQYKRLTTHMCGIKSCICGPQHGWEIEGIKRNVLLEMIDDAAYASTL